MLHNFTKFILLQYAIKLEIHHRVITSMSEIKSERFRRNLREHEIKFTIY